MKKLLIVIAAIITLVMISCGPGGGGGIVTPKAPKAEVSIDITPSTNINFGDRIDVVVSIKNAGSGTLTTSKGETFQVFNNESKNFQLIENTTFTLEASNADGVKTTTSKAVSVGSWKDNNLGLLNHQGKHWVVQDTQIIQNGEFLIIYHPDENQAGEYFIYDIDNTYYFYNRDNELYAHNGWKFLENETKLQWSFSTGTTTYTIVKLTETDLSLSEVIDYGGSPAFVIRNWTIEE